MPSDAARVAASIAGILLAFGWYLALRRGRYYLRRLTTTVEDIERANLTKIGPHPVFTAPRAPGTHASVIIYGHLLLSGILWLLSAIYWALPG